MPNFIAVELKDGEHPLPIVGEFTHLAHRKGVIFRETETLGVMTLGSRRFLRCRTDCYRLEELAAEMVTTGGRAMVIPKGSGGYTILLPGGRTGSVPGTTMQAVPLPAQRVQYRGPKLKFWERQFPSPREPLNRGPQEEK